VRRRPLQRRRGFGGRTTALADWYVGPGSRPIRDPVTRERSGGPIDHEENIVKTGIHPDYVVTQVTCSCGNSFTTRSTATSGKISVEVCSQCHPFYTGKQKILDTGGRVAKFEARFGNKKAAANKK
jgi:large subunit ribosomal protein L31